MMTTGTPERLPMTSLPWWPGAVLTGKLGMVLYGRVTASVTSPARLPSPEPQIIPSTGDTWGWS